MMSKSKLSEDKIKKPVIQVNRNRPSGKKTVDLFARMRNTEHPLDNILPAAEVVKVETLAVPPLESIAPEPITVLSSDKIQNTSEHNSSNTTETDGITGITGITNTTGITSSAGKLINHPTSPIRDFTKTPNSLTRVILAQGLFRGKSKQIYDYFWSASRGAIKSVRVFRKTHKEIQKGAGIGSRNTVIDGVKHLESIGLIRVTSAVGMAGGNEYEIFTPDEIGYGEIAGLISPTDTTDTTGTYQLYQLYQKLVIPVIPVSGITGITQTTENKSIYGDSKTSLKTIENNDDEAFAEMLEILARVTEKITGKKPSRSDSAKWRELAELLAMEFEVAAARTKSISNAPAFLTEHLRRRFASNGQPVSKTNNLSLKVGKNNPPEVEPLGDEYRLIILKTLKDFLAEGKTEFVESLQGTYAADDWKWLMQNLKKD